MEVVADTLVYLCHVHSQCIHKINTCCCDLCWSEMAQCPYQYQQSCDDVIKIQRNQEEGAKSIGGNNNNFDLLVLASTSATSETSSTASSTTTTTTATTTFVFTTSWPFIYDEDILPANYNDDIYCAWLNLKRRSNDFIYKYTLHWPQKYFIKQCYYIFCPTKIHNADEEDYTMDDNVTFYACIRHFGLAKDRSNLDTRFKWTYNRYTDEKFCTFEDLLNLKVAPLRCFNCYSLLQEVYAFKELSTTPTF